MRIGEYINSFFEEPILNYPLNYSEKETDKKLKFYEKALGVGTLVALSIVTVGGFFIYQIHKKYTSYANKEELPISSKKINEISIPIFNKEKYIKNPTEALKEAADKWVGLSSFRNLDPNDQIEADIHKMYIASSLQDVDDGAWVNEFLSERENLSINLLLNENNSLNILNNLFDKFDGQISMKNWNNLTFALDKDLKDEELDKFREFIFKFKDFSYADKIKLIRNFRRLPPQEALAKDPKGLCHFIWGNQEVPPRDALKDMGFFYRTFASKVNDEFWDKALIQIFNGINPQEISTIIQESLNSPRDFSNVESAIKASPWLAKHAANDDQILQGFWKGKKLNVVLQNLDDWHAKGIISEERCIELLDRVVAKADEIALLNILSTKFCVTEPFHDKFLKPFISKTIEKLLKDKSIDEQLSLKPQLLTKQMIKDYPEVIHSWQSDIVNHGSAEQCSNWFEKLQQFYLIERSDTHQGLIKEFIGQLSEDNLNKVLGQMHPVVDKLFLRDTNFKISQKIDQQLKREFDQPVLNQGTYERSVVRLRKWMDNRGKHHPELVDASWKEFHTLVVEKEKELKEGPYEDLQKTSFDSIMDRVKQEKKAAKLANKETSEESLILEFFHDLKEKALNQEHVSIPFYYHSTKREGLEGVLDSENQQIEVRHESVFAGAWTSTRRESIYGDYCIVMDRSIESFASSKEQAMIKKQKEGQHWVGFRKHIKLYMQQWHSSTSPSAFIDKVAEEISENNVSHISVPLEEVDQIKILLHQRNIKVPVLPVQVTDRIRNYVSEFFPANFNTPIFKQV